MHLRLEPTSGIPLGLQIAGQIRLAVAAGRLAPGARLPSARDLSAELKVNFHTVRKAYGDLERDGILRLERGKGTFVAAGAPPLDPEGLRRIVRSHVERLAEDLAGIRAPRGEIEGLVREELARALGDEGAGNAAGAGTREQEGGGGSS